MQARIVERAQPVEFPTEERCFITELWNDSGDTDVSLARARVAPGVRTQLHKLSVDERYVVVSGEGQMYVEGLGARPISAGDVVQIPAGSAQRITNTGPNDLCFLCICTPRFQLGCYQALD